MSSAVCLNLDQSKILLPGNGLNIAQMMHFFFFGLPLIENIMVQVEKCRLLDFCPFPAMSSKGLTSGSLKAGIVW